MKFGTVISLFVLAASVYVSDRLGNGRGQLAGYSQGFDAGFNEGVNEGVSKGVELGVQSCEPQAYDCPEPEIRVGTRSEFQGYIRCDQAALEFVIPFSEPPNSCNCKGEYGPEGQEKCEVEADRTHVWVNKGCKGKADDYTLEVYCEGMRGTDL